MRISDWSSDVCSSDLGDDAGDLLAQAGAVAEVVQAQDLQQRIATDFDQRQVVERQVRDQPPLVGLAHRRAPGRGRLLQQPRLRERAGALDLQQDRTSGGEGKKVAVRVALGGGRILKKKNK